MDAFDDDSDVEDSQATQILLDLVPGQASSLLSPARPVETIQSPVPLSLDVAPESFSSSRHSNSLPTYHYHGLATTQTQTQSVAEEEEEEVQEGSQKENIGQSAQGSRQTPLVSRSMRTDPSPSKAAPVRSNTGGPRSHSLAHSKARTPNTRPVAITSLNTPQMSEASPRQGRGTSTRNPRGRTARNATRLSPEPSPGPSRRSNPRLPSPDPRSRANVAAREIETSLKPFGRANMLFDDDEDEEDTTSHRSDYASGSLDHRQQGNILVDATPSNSSGSQSRSYEDQGDTQIIDYHYGLPPSTKSGFTSSPPKGEDALNDGYESSESFGRSLLVPGGSDSSPEQTQTSEPATQPGTQPGTQPAPEPEEDEVDVGNLWGTGVATAGTTTTQGTGPRFVRKTLLGMSNHRSRYKHVFNDDMPPPEVPVAPPTASTSSYQQSRPTDEIVDATTTTDWAETQATTEEDLNPPPRPNFLVRVAKNTRDVGGSMAGAGGPKASAKEAMEVVPDSEPAAEGALSPMNKGDWDEDKLKPTDQGSGGPAGDDQGGDTDDDEEEEDEVAVKPIARRPLAPAPREEEEASDDDAPLASKVKAANKKGKGVAKGAKGVAKAAAPKSKSKDFVENKKPTTKATPKSTNKKGKGVAPPSRAREPTIVPSSMPEQDVLPQVPLVPKKQAKRKTSKPEVVKRMTRLRAQRQHDYRDPDTDEDESEPPNAIAPKSTSDVAETVEAGTGDDMDVDQPVNLVEGSARKRKRATPAPQAIKQEKGKKARKTAKQDSPPAKRARGNNRDVSEDVNDASAATRVFALWKADNTYYAGVVNAFKTDLKYEVHFDDGFTGELAIEEMRSCELRPKDSVLVQDSVFPCRVVEVKEDGAVLNIDGTKKFYAMSTIKIAAKDIAYDWSDRTLTRDRIVPIVQGAHTPVKTPANKAATKKHFLANTGIVITLQSATKNPAQQKSKLTAAIEGAGGTVLHDIPSLFNMEGKFDHGGDHWILRKSDIRWCGQPVQRIFLLADNPNQKPKYLYALALGIPCIDAAWLSDSEAGGAEKPWNRYLLPQGHSSLLQMRVSQQVDLDWGNSILQLDKILESPLPLKLYKGSSVLCVGKDMLPQQPRRNQGAADMLESVNALARIILCMGAETVEAVRTPQLATKSLGDYDFIVVRDIKKIDDATWSALPKQRLVDWEWVKKCLLASRLDELPESSEASQEI